MTNGSGPRWIALAAGAALSVLAVGCGGGTPVLKPEPEPVTSGDIETWAGDGVQGHDGDGNDRLSSSFNQPMEVVFESGGGAFVVDWNNHSVRQIAASGVIENAIGTPIPGDWPCEDPANVDICSVALSASVKGDDLQLNHPMDVALDGDASFWLAAWHNHKVEHYDGPSANVTVISGLQKPGPADVNGGLANTARLNFPGSIVVQEDGGLLVSDQRNNRIRRIADGTITTVAGAAADMGGTNANDIPATTALLLLTPTDKALGADNPPPGGAIALADDGALYIADSARHCVRKVAPGADDIVNGTDAAEEIITTVAGTCGEGGHDGDDGPATAAHLQHPFDLEIGPDGALYIADTGNHAVRRVNLDDGTIEAVAGTGEPGFSGDGFPATEAQLRNPYGLAFDEAGDLFIVDTMNNRIRRVMR